MDFEAFAREQHGRLVGSLTLYCGDRWVAEELAQDALIRARERWSQVCGMQAPGAWLHRVAMNLANSHFRRRGAERRAYRRSGANGDGAVTDPDAAEALAIRRAVAALPDSQRAALVFRYFLDLSVAETAEAMGMRPGSVKSATHRAIAALREHFDIDVRVTEEVHDGS
ncbi:MAG: SigE family RNA polymerase sigma factor [Nitriliruptorales bacterium]